MWEKKCSDFSSFACWKKQQVLNSFLFPAFNCCCIQGLPCVFLIFTLHHIFGLFKNEFKTRTACVQPASCSQLIICSVPLSIPAQSSLGCPRLHRGCSVQNGLDTICCGLETFCMWRLLYIHVFWCVEPYQKNGVFWTHALDTSSWSLH